MHALVTGATGFLGNNLVLALSQLGHQVTAAIRLSSDPRPLYGIDCEALPLDLLDASAVDQAVNGVDVIIHCAAQIHIGKREQESSRRANVDTTRVLATAARRRRIRFVHVSTVDTLAATTPPKLNSETDLEPPKSEAAYVVSKRAAEVVFLAEVARGLDGIIVNPGFMVGPRDWKPTSGRMMLNLYQLPLLYFAPGGGCCAVDIRNVVQGILAAIERGKAHERYILGGENVTYLELWQKMAQTMGKRPPVRPMKDWLASTVGCLGDGVGRLTGKDGELNSISLEMGQKFHWYSSQKAIDQLGYQITSLETALRDSWDWFIEHGYVKGKLLNKKA